MEDMKYTVLTFLFGKNYDKLINPTVIDPEATYVCVTDDFELKSDIWNIVYVNIYDDRPCCSQGAKKSFIIRWNWYDFCDTDICIVCDGAVGINDNLQRLVNKAYNYDCMFLVHPLRHNLYDEYVAWIEGRNLDKKYMDNFIEYTKNSYDIFTKGLFAPTTMILKKNDIMIQFSKDVLQLMEDISKMSDRVDQIYMSYLINTKYFNSLDIMFVSFKYLYTTFFSLYEHNSDIRYVEFCTDNCIWQNNKKIHLYDYEI